MHGIYLDLHKNLAFRIQNFYEKNKPKPAGNASPSPG